MPTRRTMKTQQEPSAQEVLAGVVERVTLHNAESGFCVLRIKARGYRDLVAVVGHAPIISAGEWVTASGDWVNDHTHGQQFKARFLHTSPPTSVARIVQRRACDPSVFLAFRPRPAMVGAGQYTTRLVYWRRRCIRRNSRTELTKPVRYGIRLRS